MAGPGAAPVISSTLEAEKESYKFISCLSDLMRPCHKIKGDKMAVSISQYEVLA